MISVEQYNVTKQSIQNKHIKIELLNKNLTPFVGAELSGNCIDGNITVDANSDIRRTCSVLFVVTDSTFDIGESHYIWLNRYVKISIGIDSFTTNDIVWFNMGIFLIDAPSVDYDAENYSLRFTGLDMMSQLSGTRNGYLEGIPTLIPQGSNVRQAMIAALQLGGITRYNISECTLEDGTIQDVPYDITLEQGSTIYDMLVALRDILPYYEIFFDNSGTFVYQKIPTGEDESVIATDDLFNQVLLSESIDTDFQSIKNVIEVYGRTISPTYFATNVVVTADAEEDFTYINLTVPDYVLDTVSYIGFTLSEDISQYIMLRINNNNLYPLVWQDRKYVDSHVGTINDLSEGDYMINYSTSNAWELSNYGQIYAIVKDENPNSPFYIGKVGEIRKPLYGGEYDNITTNPLAYERANWELYKATRLQDTINMNIVPVYYFEANQLINHAVKDTTQELPYMIKSYNLDLKTEGTMSLTAIRYYAEYPTI